MGKQWSFIAAILLLIACGERKKDKEITEESPDGFVFNGFNDEIEFGEKAASIIADWPEYRDLQSSFSVLKRASNTEDVKLAIDDLIEKEKALEDSEYPVAYDRLQIKSRQQVFKTFLYKVKGHLNDGQDIVEPMQQLMDAYNALKDQMNRLVNNTLDTKSILNDQ